MTSIGLKNEAVDEDLKATGAKKKRDGKRARKEETKRAAVEEPALGKRASEAAETPLRINMTMLVAMERREAVKAFAVRKFAPADGSEDDGTVLEVIRAIFAFEAMSQNFFAHLEPQTRSASKEQQPARLHPFTAQDLSSRLQGTSVSKIEQALMTIAADQSDLVTSLVQDNNVRRYAVNWGDAFAKVQASLIDQVVTGAYGSGKGAHFCRVLRILRQRGFMEEKEIVKLSLLPQKNVLAIVNRFLADGLLLTQEMPIKGGSSVGLAGGLLLYGVSAPALQKKMGHNVAKSVLNVMLATGGTLGKLNNLTLEMNHLLL